MIPDLRVKKSGCPFEVCRFLEFACEGSPAQRVPISIRKKHYIKKKPKVSNNMFPDIVRSQVPKYQNRQSKACVFRRLNLLFYSQDASDPL